MTFDAGKKKQQRRPRRKQQQQQKRSQYPKQDIKPMPPPSQCMMSSMPLPDQPVAEFLYQLTRIMANENSDVIEWSDGRITVHDPPRLEREVLSKYFRHSKYTSFHRQLNYFGFKKLTGKGKLAPCSYGNDATTNELRSLLFIKRRTKPSPGANVSASACDDSSRKRKAVDQEDKVPSIPKIPRIVFPDRSPSVLTTDSSDDSLPSCSSPNSDAFFDGTSTKTHSEGLSSQFLDQQTDIFKETTDNLILQSYNFLESLKKQQQSEALINGCTGINSFDTRINTLPIETNVMTTPCLPDKPFQPEQDVHFNAADFCNSLNVIIRERSTSSLASVSSGSSDEGDLSNDRLGDNRDETFEDDFAFLEDPTSEEEEESWKNVQYTSESLLELEPTPLNEVKLNSFGMDSKFIQLFG